MILKEINLPRTLPYRQTETLESKQIKFVRKDDRNKEQIKRIFNLLLLVYGGYLGPLKRVNETHVCLATATTPD